MSKPGDNRARRTDPDTSHDAAAISSKQKGTLDRKILDFLVARGDLGATSRETAHHIPHDHTCVSPRFARLEEAGFIHRTGAKRASKETRCKSQIWYIGQPKPEQGQLL